MKKLKYGVAEVDLFWTAPGLRNSAGSSSDNSTQHFFVIAAKVLLNYGL